MHLLYILNKNQMLLCAVLFRGHESNCYKSEILCIFGQECPNSCSDLFQSGKISAETQTFY
jgi:hypothetical protein